MSHISALQRRKTVYKKHDPTQANYVAPCLYRQPPPMVLRLRGRRIVSFIIRRLARNHLVGPPPEGKRPASFSSERPRASGQDGSPVPPRAPHQPLGSLNGQQTNDYVMFLFHVGRLAQISASAGHLMSAPEGRYSVHLTSFGFPPPDNLLYVVPVSPSPLNVSKNLEPTKLLKRTCE